MFDFLEWYFPWSSLDWPLKMTAIAWAVSTVLGIWLFVRTVILKKPWLSMRHLQLPPEQTKE